MIKRLQDAFYKSGLLGEFLETIINDRNEVLSRKLLRQVWTLCTTEWDHVDEVVVATEELFSQSTDELDLDTKWRAMVAHWWPKLPDMPLKKEIDDLDKSSHRVDFHAWTDDPGSVMLMFERFNQFQDAVRGQGQMFLGGKTYNGEPL